MLCRAGSEYLSLSAPDLPTNCRKKKKKTKRFNFVFSTGVHATISQHHGERKVKIYVELSLNCNLCNRNCVLRILECMCVSYWLARYTFGAEHLLARPGQGNSMVTLFAVAYGIVLHLGAGRVLIRKSATRAVETLLPESFSWKNGFYRHFLDSSSFHFNFDSISFPLPQN